ncbi:pyridoxamine 5'-phosphate oxidase [Crocinitomix catalasitica]|uniref:pyridoxamine 5'-phosphate oxidase n=1 Tax=Crocinitomix catalasitica TaxID=184607 RepID=UPI000485ED23|nr:pyridoxamine 5'-phosphate oxidase [Crocinitomix catalasitica]
MNHLDETRNEHNDFLKGSLSESLVQNPYKLFEQWYDAAYTEKCVQPNNIVLSTVSASGQPSSRILFLREYDKNGFVFYTNYNSHKGVDISKNNRASILFFWSELERQIRVEGTIRKVSAEQSDAYFKSRPRLSQLGAWTSNQSEKVPNRAFLEKKMAEMEKKFPNEVPRPPHWGGYIIEPTFFEFWQGRAGRLHDRICFEKNENNWDSFRISP